MDLKSLIREVPDFPQPGVNFKDISTLIKNGEAFRHVVSVMADYFRSFRPDIIVGIESRGYILGAPLAYELGCGFVLVRKPGKLPAATKKIEYTLEYGTNALEIHQDAVSPGERVLIVDDVLATGGTVSATTELVRELGGEVIGYAFLVELSFLRGRGKLTRVPVLSLAQYDEE